jgi:DNA-binding beta-propeller fold protein YncE
MRVLALCALVLALGAERPATHHYEYVFPDRQVDVYDLDHGFQRVAHWLVPEAHALRGVAVSPVTGRLYFSVGGNGGSSGSGSIVAYDLVRRRVLWVRRFPTGTDSLAITPNGRTLFVPEGERSAGDVWYMVDASTGRVRSEIHAGPGPHNTIVAPDGRLVYLGPRNSRWLYVASAATGRIVRRVGPLKPGVRPFTIDGAQRFAFTTATGVLGFQVSSLRTGHVLYSVRLPTKTVSHGGTPSHGISITPDSREVDVIDVPDARVYAYDVSGLPAHAPRLIAETALQPDMKGQESPCGGDCGRAGWLQTSLDGRWLFVGDDGDVIDLRTHRVAAFLPALHNSRYLFELDWREGKPVRTSTRSGIGYPPRG